jgi:hypothetical protein
VLQKRKRNYNVTVFAPLHAAAAVSKKPGRVILDPPIVVCQTEIAEPVQRLHSRTVELVVGSTATRQRAKDYRSQSIFFSPS